MSKRVVMTEGKRFTRREVEKVTTDDGDFYFEKINWNTVYTRKTLEEYRRRAVDVLRANGFEVEELLSQSPHGSILRDYVINTEGAEPDSLPALAARIIELISHVVAYGALPGGERKMPALIFDLGRTTALFDVYQIDGAIQRKRRKDKPLADSYDTGRNDRLREYHRRLAGQNDATEQTAQAFGVTTRTVNRIVRGK